MSTALAERTQTELSPAGMGKKDAVAEIHRRIVAMMPGAAEAPQEVQWAAAQLAVMHGLNPFNGEIYCIKIGNKKDANGQWVGDYRAHVGIKGLRKLARRRAEFMTDERVMDDDEVQVHRRDLYHPDDIGVEITLYRLDLAEKCSRLGIPYKPVKAVGFWRKQAQYHNKNKEWMEDNIPNTWSALMVAEKRGEINAIKKAFDMEINVSDPAREIEDDLKWRVEQMHRDEAPMLNNRIEPEDDGELLYASPRYNPEPTPERVEDEGEWAAALHPQDTGTDPETQRNGDGAPTQAAVNQRYNKAKAWAMQSGKFNARPHMENAWAKLFAEHKAHEPQNADAFLSAWKEYVDKHEPAETSQPVAA